ncbi:MULTISPECIES: hypothetical protein [unclassified Halomonas]|uniref:hypothetical protein n=1 Tax=unclassified Halomonas TaxID=2609666 RepID=UPI002076B391|nr:MULTISPECIES: hypothetical protein [unclassified Halomonas]
MILEGTLYNAGGPLPSVKIKFGAYKTSLNGVLRDSSHAFTTGPDGSYTVELEPGYYNVVWSNNGREEALGQVIADADSVMSLPQALEASPTPITDERAQGLVEQILATKAEVQRLADQAEQSEKNAAQAATDALNAIMVPIFDEMNGVKI